MKIYSKFRLPLKFSPLFFLIFLSPLFFKSDSDSGTTSQWFTLPNLPFNVEFNVTLGWTNQDTNYIITAGGRINDTTSNEVLIYNTVSQQYMPLPPLPVPLERAGGFIIKDSIYIVGGAMDTSKNFINNLIRLDLTNPVTWEPRTNFPFNIGEITYSSAAMNDSIAYVAGGHNGGGAVNNVLLYDVNLDNWFPANQLPGPGLYGGGLATVNDTTLLFVGGRNGVNISQQTIIGRIDPVSPAGINWIPGPVYPSGQTYYTGIWGTKEGDAFMTGGSNSTVLDNNRASGKTFRYSESTNTIDTLAEKPTPVTHTQIFGFPLGAGTPKEYEVYAPGGSGVSNRAAFDVNERLYFIDSLISGIIKVNSNVPAEYLLEQNYPNPFNPETIINFQLSMFNMVKLSVYDISGKEVAILINEELQPGVYEYKFNGAGLASGMYFYRLSAGGGEFSDTKKMLLIK